MKKLPFLWACALFLTAAQAPSPRDLAGQVSQSSLRATIDRLVGFGTRHSLSSQTDPKRGVGAALRWSDAQLRSFGLDVSTIEDMVTVDAGTGPVRVADVIAIQKGAVDPDRVVIIVGHIDSRVGDLANADTDAPGANDNGSGCAAVIEAARILSAHEFPVTIVYALVSGEEQGLFGAKLLAEHAKNSGWTVMAVLNNDIIGASCGSDGLCDNSHVRLFSSGLRGDMSAAVFNDQLLWGGENDSPSRNLSRFIDHLADQLGDGLDVRPIWRGDRLLRAGDQMQMVKYGFPAVRFTAGIENQLHQHQDVKIEGGVQYGDTIAFVDFNYLARVTGLNVATLAALARAPAMPVPHVRPALSPDTTIAWKPSVMAATYRVHWRATDAPGWTNERAVAGSETQAVFKSLRSEDWIFGVSAVSADGYETPVVSAIAGGAFGPLTR